jgi:site-specific DNA-cytosine methylase
VEEKYYLSQRAIDGISNSMFAQKQQQVQDTNEICSTILSRDYKDPKCVLYNPYNNSIINDFAPTQTSQCGKQNTSATVLKITPIKENALIELTTNQSQGNRVYDNKGVSVTLSANGGGMGAKTGLYAIRNIMNENSEASTLGTNCGSCTSSGGGVVVQKAEILINRGIMLVNGIPHYVRKLTPLETWRLMGFSDNDFYAAQKVNSNAQLYKQAGNSIVVNVLMAIFGQLYGIDWKPIVYGKHYKNENQRLAELPMFCLKEEL